jgi:tRNA-Thr(GGU) m(6)t(6)A37 methyltransferase TsaA
MSEESFQYESIGVIWTPFESPDGMPIQPAGTDTVGTVEVHESYADGLQDLDGFSHCILLYHFHEATGAPSLQAKPFLDDEERGIFSIRAPARPNPIGLSVVKIDTVTTQEVTVSGIDIVDGTPLLDIKPFVPDFDIPDEVDTGWFDASQSTIQSTQADERFL